MYPPYDPYAVLGLPRSADLAQVKKTFRTLAKKHHPDINPNDQRAVAHFQELNRAYELIVAEKNAPPPPQSPFPHYQAPVYYPPQYGHYPPQNPHHPPYYQQNPPPQSGFQSYSWENWDGQDHQPVEKTPPPPAPEPEPEPTPPPPEPPTPWREDLLQISFEEAWREAKNRADEKNLSAEEKLEQDIRNFLQTEPPHPNKRHQTKSSPSVKLRKKNGTFLGFSLK